MRLDKRLLKKFLAVSLALLVTFLSIGGMPQIALSQARSFLASLSSSKQIIVATSPRPAEKSPFSDVKNHWAQAYIDELAARKIIVGYPDGKYRPGHLEQLPKKVL
jgi:S-layer homology domain